MDLKHVCRGRCCPLGDQVELPKLISGSHPGTEFEFECRQPVFSAHSAARNAHRQKEGPERSFKAILSAEYSKVKGTHDTGRVRTAECELRGKQRAS